MMPTHCLELTPSDLVFFKDGRPMEGSASGCGAAWPLPNVISSALHHALRRAAHAEEVHSHTPKRNGIALAEEAERQFGSLQSVGPFPVCGSLGWCFTRPADAQASASAIVTHRPLKSPVDGASSSLPGGLLPVVASVPPSKDAPEPWFDRSAYEAYLGGDGSVATARFLKDESLFGAEHRIGIGISSETGTQDGERIYSASYLRLRENVRLGVLASCMDKGAAGFNAENDLIASTFPSHGDGTRILAGGQQRICTTSRSTPTRLPLPMGSVIEGTRVKWTLLSPAIFPEIREDLAKEIPAHPGGWLPTWIDTQFQLQLKAPAASRRQPREGRKAWRVRVAALPPIQACLVAALIDKPIPVTGWALQDVDDGTGLLSAPGGAKSTHLAVPAGSVYYFECADEAAATKLAAALNWHGESPGTEIRNRRSTLMGEKGFGLGVCGTWTFHPKSPPSH